MLTILLQLAGGTAFLYYGADFLVKGGVSIATRFGVSALVIGLTLVAFATSAPELVVSVQAALAGSSDISIGNVIGSNICNIALILGLSAVIAPLSVHRKVLRFDLPVMAAVTLAMAAIGLLLGGFNRLTGAVFFAGLLAYIAWNIRLEKRDGSGDAETEIREEVENSRKYPLWLAAAFVIGGAAALVLGGKFIVDGAVGLGRMAHLSEAVIGLTIVAVGTSLPELATSLVAAARGEQDIAVGNVVGSNLFNMLGIMGIAPMIRPVSAAGITPVDWGMLLVSTLLLVPFMHTGRKVVRREGAVLLALYCAYIAFLAVNA
ncbi:calcium/sodium antiporter [uncultured Victivallis sp.]|uniref:calcium/sodium antiporter n=1 Tax=uncultured Victivallis sp. TaxID=354118 RepID=UPI002599B5C7|nr:calcium/sodium antiporter [uncultured Victivallis sp.]